MTEEEKKKNSREKWIHYQNVKPLNIYVEPTEEDKIKIKNFEKFIREQEEKRKKNREIDK